MARVKQRIMPMFADHLRAGERITFVISGQPMDDDSLILRRQFHSAAVLDPDRAARGTWADVEAGIRRTDTPRH